MAIKVYERVPASSPLKRNAQIQLATDLDAADRSDEAIKILKSVIAEDPKDLEAIMALGNIERGRKKFADCAADLSQGIDVLPPNNDKANSVYYYYRGICEERSKQWAKAEADMKKALELQPEQPHVLNYLGYSWIDQGINLDEGMKMIKRAVEQRPDDGYIVDSLGWAYFRIGNYEEAVKNLERAIDLKPEDPTINDHLGDAYWRVGRTLEAKFQWAHARDLKPEPEELPKIEAKIANGLPDDPSSSAASSDDKKKEDSKAARAADRRAGASRRCWFTAVVLTEDGRAKVNLTLRVIGRRVDGYHDLESVVAFADCADRLTLDPGPDLKLTTTGPLAQACGEMPDNLVLKAARLLAERVPDLRARRLQPRQGVAGRRRHWRRFGGCGGGAAAAGAAQWSIARRSTRASRPRSDGGRRAGLPRLVRLRHDRRRRKPDAAESAAIALRDGQSTRRGRDQGCLRRAGPAQRRIRVGVTDVIEAAAWPEQGASIGDWIEALSRVGNDLEAPAIRVQPAISGVLSALRASQGALLARMSGSGATCFAIYADTADAQTAARDDRCRASGVVGPCGHAELIIARDDFSSNRPPAQSFLSEP